MSLAVQLDRAGHRVGAGVRHGTLSAQVLRATRGHQWPSGVIAIPAVDLFDLESPSTAEAIRSLIDLCQTFGRDEFLIMDLEGLADPASCHSCASRVEMLEALILGICSRDLSTSPQFELQMQVSQVDLGVQLFGTHLVPSPVL